MKWTVGALALLVGVGGCSFFHSDPESSAQSFAYQPFSPPPLGAARGTSPNNAGVTWSGDPGSGSVARYASTSSTQADYTCARPSLPATPIPAGLLAGTSAGSSSTSTAAPEPEPLPPAPPPPTRTLAGADDIIAPLPTPQQPQFARAQTSTPEPPAPMPAPVQEPTAAPPAAPVPVKAPVTVTAQELSAPSSATRVASLLTSRPLPPLSKQNPEPIIAPVIHTEVQPKKIDSSVSNLAGPKIPDAHLVSPRGMPKVRVVDTAVRMVKSRRFTLNFAFRDVGPSGVSAVELWYTQDGQDWKMHEVLPKKPPYVVEVDEEGRYGFTLLARSGVGLGPKPPAPGDEPQMWVVVDQTAPEVQLIEVSPTKTTPKPALVIQWKATDANFARQPVSLMYAEREAGPWQPIATNLFNSGHYTWEMPENMPGQFLVRVEAVDLAGNVGHTQTTTPVILDTSMPQVKILAIEAGGR